jgi:hypothetical protein
MENQTVGIDPDSLIFVYKKNLVKYTFSNWRITWRFQEVKS